MGSALFVNSRPLDNSLATPERGLQPQARGFLNRVDPLDSVYTVLRKIFAIFCEQRSKRENKEPKNTKPRKFEHVNFFTPCVLWASLARSYV